MSKAAPARRPFRAKKQQYEENSWQDQLSKVIKAFKACCKEADLKDAAYADLLQQLNRQLEPDEDDVADGKVDAVPKKLIVSSPVTGVDPQAFRALCVSLSTVKYAVLTAVCVWNADIGDAGLIDLAKALPSLPNVTKLEVTHSLVGAAGCEALATHCLARKKTARLTILRLDHNPAIGSAGAGLLCDALCTNDTLKTLSLAYCGIGPDGADHLTRMLASADTKVRTLNLAGNALHNPGIVVLCEGLVKNHGALTSLNVSHTGFGHNGCNDLSGVKMIAAALRLCPALSTCHMEGNFLGNDGCQLLVTALNGATHVRELTVTPMGIDRVIFDMLLSFLTANQPEPKKKLKKKKKPEPKYPGATARSGRGTSRTPFAGAADSGSARIAASLAAAKTQADAKAAAAATAASKPTTPAAAGAAKDAKAPPAAAAAAAGTTDAKHGAAPTPTASAAPAAAGGGGGAAPAAAAAATKPPSPAAAAKPAS